MDARLDYKFVINGSSWILDPENPNTCTGGFGPNSELSMPNYVQPREIEYDPSIMHGKLIYKNIFSSNVNTNYQVTIYLPPNYDSLSNKIYPTAYFQDGTEYITLGKAVNVIDNLIEANKIQPFIGVFVKPNNRNEEYAYSKREQYRLFFVNELVPFIDSSLKTIQDSKRRLVLGDSFGGNISALISYYHPEIFGLCGLHSAAFWVNNYEAYNLIINGEKKDIKFSSIWGTYESLFINMRSFRDFLLTNDYELDWIEKHEGHSWGLWRSTLDDMLKFFFPYEPTGIGEDKNYILNEFKLFQNYPNPFNPSTIIEYSIPAVASTFSLSQDVRITIYDILGREVATLVNSNRKPGSYQVEFNASKFSSGIYYYQLTVNVSGEKGTNRFVETKKMVFLE